MTCTNEIIINCNLESCIKKLNNPKNLTRWQRGLVNFDFISGVPGRTGSKMQLHYIFNKKDFFLTQTISKSDFPHLLYMELESKGLYTIQKNYFKEVAENKTVWTSTNEFIPTTLKMRVLLLLMPKTFKKQSAIYLKDFKNFVENNVSVQN